MPLKLRFWVWASALFIMVGVISTIEFLRREEWIRAVFCAGLFLSLNQASNEIPYFKRVVEEIKKHGQK